MFNNYLMIWDSNKTSNAFKKLSKSQLNYLKIEI